MKILRYIVFISLLLPNILVAGDQVETQPNGVAIVTIGEGKSINEMAVYPSGGIADRPLLIAAHGNGGSGPQELESWIDLAKQHKFTVVCPTFLSAVHVMYAPMDAPYFKECLHWIEGNLVYNKRNVYMTGFSGGGYPVWYLATTRPDFFKGLFLQSGNFAGNQYYGFSLSDWTNKPIHLAWGTEDSPTVTAQNKQLVDLAQSMALKNFTTDVIRGAHHEPHHDLVVKWMEEQMASDSSH